MNDLSAELKRKITLVACEVPAPIVESVATEIEALSSGAGSSDGATIAARVTPASARHLVGDLLREWASSGKKVSPEVLAWALRGALMAATECRDRQTVELVWTGPTASGSSFRRTDQVLLDLTHGARESLIVVTFAAYKIPELAGALIAAARRGVRVMLILESAEESGGRISFETLTGIGAEVAAVSEVYVWPRDRRETDAAGHYGSLHAKCALADDDALLVSSANLTDYALNLNMELGVLIRGGGLPRQVREHLRRLVGEGVLQMVQSRPRSDSGGR